MEPGPIFIGGVERSGTSLLYALLTSHPNIALTRRTNLWTYIDNRFGDLRHAGNFERCLAAMMHYRRILILNPDPERIRREFWEGEPTYKRLFTLLWTHYAERAGKPRWGDKSLNTERYTDRIFSFYPNARILHIIRDPRDRYASALKRWKVIRGGTGSGTAMWLNSVNLAKRNLAKYPDSYKVVRYETLAASPEATLKEICDFIGEAYTPLMLNMSGAEMFRNEGGNSSFENHDPGAVSTRSIGRYAKFLSPREIACIQTLAGDNLRTFGYDLDPLRLSLFDLPRFALLDLPLNLARLAAWRYRENLLDRKGREIPSDRVVSEALVI